MRSNRSRVSRGPNLYEALILVIRISEARGVFVVNKMCDHDVLQASSCRSFNETASESPRLEFENVQQSKGYKKTCRVFRTNLISLGSNLSIRDGLEMDVQEVLRSVTKCHRGLAYHIGGAAFCVCPTTVKYAIFKPAGFFLPCFYSFVSLRIQLQERSDTHGFRLKPP